MAMISKTFAARFAGQDLLRFNRVYSRYMRKRGSSSSSMDFPVSAFIRDIVLEEYDRLVASGEIDEKNR